MMFYIPRDSVNTPFDGVCRRLEFDPVGDPEVGFDCKWRAAFSDQLSAQIILDRQGPIDGLADR